MSKIYSVDFDGTLNTENVFPDVGNPNIPLMQKLITLRADGAKLILNTCRNGKHLKAAVDFCKQYGLEFDAVNENLPSIIDAFNGNDTRKIVASYYIDDRAVAPGDFLRMATHESFGAAGSKKSAETIEMPVNLERD
ncbi:MAG: hypothetical protein Q4C12_08915 [Clostridia bacterium]|nr:hypothetical protein [Clostridia bacterium]